MGRVIIIALLSGLVTYALNAALGEWKRYKRRKEWRKHVR